MLDEQSPISLYNQLRDLLLEKIRKGEWKPNDKIPTERELCKIYGVSRITVRQALESLSQEGYIYKKQGRGTFVKSKKYEQPLGSLYSFGEEIRKSGGIPSSTILDFKVGKVTEPVASKLGLIEGENVYLLERLRNADNSPYAMEVSSIPCSVVNGLNVKILEEKGLYASLRELAGIIPTQADETFEAIILPDNVTTKLNTKRHSAGFLIERITYWRDVPIEHCLSYVRGDKYKYHIVLK